MATFALIGLRGPANAGAITEIVAFGDSLSDVGNTFAAAGVPSSPPNYPGVYSNGPNWLSYLAGSLGVATPTASLAGGTDYAWGGAETGAGTSSQGTPNLGLQVQTFLASHILNGGQLVTIWAGANDFLNGGQTNPAVVVDNIAGAITALAGAGGMHFLVPNLPLLSELPATSVYPQSVRDALGGLTSAFNGLLEARLVKLSQELGITIDNLDVDREFRQIIADPAAYGLTNVTGVDPRSTLGGVGDGQSYLFWDAVHPTTAVHELIGREAYNEIVPEPSSIALLAISASASMALVAARNARRNKAA